MSIVGTPSEVRMVEVSAIEVLNPRERNDKVFDEIVVNIKRVGIKKPITVTPRPGPDGVERYLLVCGEGRLKAFKALGESRIPALVVDVSDEDAFIMSLAENIARRQYRPLELLAGIEQLREKGYNAKTIAAKTGLTQTYVQGILTLLQQGEQRLIVAVEHGEIPLNAALTIVGAGDDDKAIQAALQDAAGSQPDGCPQDHRAPQDARQVTAACIAAQAAGGVLGCSGADLPERGGAPEADGEESRVHPAQAPLRDQRFEAIDGRRALCHPAARRGPRFDAKAVG
jgi:ParB/RepB/Spo0J family partition protein